MLECWNVKSKDNLNAVFFFLGRIACAESELWSSLFGLGGAELDVTKMAGMAQVDLGQAVLKVGWVFSGVEFTSGGDQRWSMRINGVSSSSVLPSTQAHWVTVPWGKVAWGSWWSSPILSMLLCAFHHCYVRLSFSSFLHPRSLLIISRICSHSVSWVQRTWRWPIRK